MFVKYFLRTIMVIITTTNIIQKQPPQVFCKKGVLRNFAKFTGKHLCQSLFFNKVPSLRAATLLKKRLWYWCFPKNFTKFQRTPFLQNTSGRLVLIIVIITKISRIFNSCIYNSPCLSERVFLMQAFKKYTKIRNYNSICKV